MGLKSTIQVAAKQALVGLGDLHEDMDYIKNTGEVYDPATGENVIQCIKLDIKGVRVNFKSREIDGTTVELDDFKVLTLVQDLSVTPNIKDEIIVQQIKYRVKNFAKDPADAVWIIQVGL